MAAPPKIDSQGMVCSPCGSFRFFYDDYDPAPSFYSSVNTGLCISDGRRNTIVDFLQADWNAPFAPAFPASGMAVVEVARSGGKQFVLALDIAEHRYRFRPFTQRPPPEITPEAPDWRAGLDSVEPTMRAAADA